MHSDKKKDNRLEQYMNQNHVDEIMDLDALYEEDATDITSKIDADKISHTDTDHTALESSENTKILPNQDAVHSDTANSLDTYYEDTATNITETLCDSPNDYAQTPEDKSAVASGKAGRNSIAVSNGKRKKTPNKSFNRQSDGVAAKEKAIQRNRSFAVSENNMSKGRSSLSNPYGVLTVILALTTLVSISLCVYVIVTNDKAAAETISEEIIETESTPDIILYDQQQVDELVLAAKEEAANQKEVEIKDYIRSVATVKSPNFAEMLRQLYPEEIVYADTDGYHFIPIDESLGLHSIKKEQLFTDGSDNFTYVEDSVVTSSRGIDVSQHQGNIDWNQVADSGVEFAIIRVGFRGYGSGALVLDEQFQRNIEGAANAGLEVGVYFFTQAISAEEAVEEAAFVVEALEPYSITGPVVIDVERPDDSSARGNAITAADRTGYVKLFCDAVEKEGYSAMIYGNTYSMFAMLDLSQLTDYSKWYAFYNDYLYYPYEVDIWQYSATAKVPGISGDVDMNIRFTKTEP